MHLLIYFIDILINSFWVGRIEEEIKMSVILVRLKKNCNFVPNKYISNSTLL